MRTLSGVSAVAAAATAVVSFGPIPPGSVVAEIIVLMDKGTTAADVFYLLGAAVFSGQPTVAADFEGAGRSLVQSIVLLGTNIPAVRGVRGQSIRIPVNVALGEFGWVGVIVSPVTDAMSGTVSLVVIPGAV